MEMTKDITEKLIKAMGSDNDCTFLPTPKQIKSLSIGVEVMRENGCSFSYDEIEDIAAGEVDEVDERFNGFNGWKIVNEVMGNIFNGKIK